MSQIMRGICFCLSAVLFGVVPSAAAAQQFPSQPIRLVVPYPPGGSADILARLLGEKMQGALRQPVVVENRPGAGTVIGARFVAGAPADGHTLLLGTVSSHAMTPAMNGQSGYDPVTDFSAIGPVASMPFALLVRQGLGVDNFQAFLKHLKNNPDSLTFSSAGIGTSNHMAGELLNFQANTVTTHVPYRGSAPAMNALMAGDVDFMFDLVATAVPHIKGGKLTALATTGSQRSPFLPDLPTVAEQGLPDFEVTAWFGLFGPDGIPSDVVATLNSAVNDILADEAVQERFKQMGISPQRGTSAEYGQFVASEAKKWQSIVKASNIAVSQ